MTRRQDFSAPQREQLEREREAMRLTREAAARYLEVYARRHGWSDDDLITIKDVLGLTLDPSLGLTIGR